jgi:hypothetical protein
MPCKLGGTLHFFKYLKRKQEVFKNGVGFSFKGDSKLKKRPNGSFIVRPLLWVPLG